MRRKILDAIAAICVITPGTVVAAKVLAPFGIVKFFVIGGIITALIRSLKGRDKGFWQILINDYRIDRFATLSLLRFTFTICQGVAFGASIGCLVEGITTLYIPLIPGAIVPLIALVIIRVLLEWLSLMFKATESLALMSRSEK